MIILIEGLNCTGKTTLAEKFSEHLKIPVLKFNVPGEDVYQEFYSGLKTAITEHRHFIIDRMHLSNYAYNGQLGGSVLSPADWALIDAIVAEQQSFLYWMLDTPHAIEARLQQRAGRQDAAEQLTRIDLSSIHNRFAEAYSRSTIPVKGSFMLPQFVDYDTVTEQFQCNLRVIRMVMAGMTC